MRKIIVFILAIMMVVVGTASAFDYFKSSGHKTGSALITTGPGVFAGIVVTTNGSTATEFNVFDSTSLDWSATQLMTSPVVVTTSAIDRVQIISPPSGPVEFSDGLYIYFTTPPTSYTVFYR